MAEEVSFKNEEKLSHPEDVRSEGNDTTENGTNQDYGSSPGDEDNDEADGFITQYLMSPKGTYSPRQHEKESWGSDIDQTDKPEDRHDAIFHLIKNTAPEVRWREGLFFMLKECSKSETSTRKCLAFLHSNAVNGIKTVQKREENVHIGSNPAPKCLTCPDWMVLMEGLNFVLTSPGAVRNIEHVDVTVGKKTDTDALTGFCHLMKAMLDMTWTNLQLVNRIEKKEGRLLNDTLATLCSGYGIEESDRSKIEELETKYPFLMKSLGFKRSDKHAKLQWQRPDPDKEFQCLCLTFHGLFRSADKIESVL